MGGGNLNLKKSWHPSTLKNQERVWKAQQQDESERRKMEELRHELQSQREKEEYQDIADRASGSTETKSKMDWMYKGVSALVDREDYLLGRKIDKTFDVIKAAEEQAEKGQQNNEKSEGLPSQLFKKRQIETDFVPVDMAIKVREDPLYMIKKQEYESKKQLLSNPVKMKMLQDMIRKEKGKKHGKSKKKKKKHKKHLKRIDSSASESSSSPERDLRCGHGQSEVANRLGARQRDSPIHHHERRNSTDRGDKSFGKDAHSAERGSNRNPARGSQAEYAKSPRKERSIDRTTNTNYDYMATHSNDRRSHSPIRRSDRDRSMETNPRNSSNFCTRNRPREPESPEPSRSWPRIADKYGLVKTKESAEDGAYPKKDYRLILEERRRKEEKERRELKDRLKHRSTQKMTQEEREARLREMQHDAELRNRQREEYVQKHTKGDAIHVEDYKEGGFRGAEMLARAVSDSNVERRLKSSLKGLKRSSRIMDSNFFRK
ncbi:hypothetical protein BIW11_03298 [Tropilaelaps mercedesae]|uniref:CBF1-interacting co-repressor CIR N-terminal domain-containing protein n=1 Tax=Tropilaelaps mercedesae TaxID=418985 RepID=A0A1V9XP65_9ACAR|nr:hypothetical protein BIW11_03298 [Tropilaelaps mercedesae]